MRRSFHLDASAEDTMSGSSRLLFWAVTCLVAFCALSVEANSTLAPTVTGHTTLGPSGKVTTLGPSAPQPTVTPVPGGLRPDGLLALAHSVDTHSWGGRAIRAPGATATPQHGGPPQVRLRPSGCGAAGWKGAGESLGRCAVSDPPRRVGCRDAF